MDGIEEGRYAALGEEEAQRCDSGTCKSGASSAFLRSVRCGACTRYRRLTLVLWASFFGAVAFLGPAVVDWRFRTSISKAVQLADAKSPSYAAWLTNVGGSAVRYDVYYL